MGPQKGSNSKTMPKGKRKERANGSGQNSDDDSFNDNASLTSNSSELRINENCEAEEVDDVSQVLEDKLVDMLDGLTQKSAQGRINCLESVQKAFVKKYMPDFVFDRRITICDAIERSLKKGKGAEQAAAAQLAPLLLVQLGAGDAGEEIYKMIKPILNDIGNDNTLSPLVRAKCFTALGMMTFLAGEDIGEVLELMKHLEQVFSGSYLKGDSSVPNVPVETATLHAATVSAWAMLLTLISPGDVYSMLGDGISFSPSLEQLSELLTSTHLDVRLAAGEALALVFELGREYSEDFAEGHVPELVETLKQLATDSHKYRAKKERKQQRATFRDVLNLIENDQEISESIKFGVKEVLLLDSWTRRKQYESFCNIISGINVHLTENYLLREIFELGERVMILQPRKQRNEYERLMHSANFKARTISRRKNRDKRSDF